MATATAAATEVSRQKHHHHHNHEPRPIIIEQETGEVFVLLAYVDAILPREYPLSEWAWEHDNDNDDDKDDADDADDDGGIRIRGYNGYVYSPLKYLNSLLLDSCRQPLLRLELVSNRPDGAEGHNGLLGGGGVGGRGEEEEEEKEEEEGRGEALGLVVRGSVGSDEADEQPVGGRRDDRGRIAWRASNVLPDYACSVCGGGREGDQQAAMKAEVEMELDENQSFQLEGYGDSAALFGDNEADDINIITTPQTPQPRPPQQDYGTTTRHTRTHSPVPNRNQMPQPNNTKTTRAPAHASSSSSSLLSSPATPSSSSTGFNKTRRGLLLQLRDLDLTHRVTLEQLLDNAFVPALSKLHGRPPEGLVHLATLRGGEATATATATAAAAAAGRVYSVRIFKQPYARREDLSFASLLDAMMAATGNDNNNDDNKKSSQTRNHRRLTTYQVYELSHILQTISRTTHGGLFWAPFEDMWPAEWPAFQRRTKDPAVSLSAISRRLHHHRDYYTTLSEFRVHVDRIRDNAERFWGPWDERAGAARMTVEEVYRLMGQSCAVGPMDGGGEDGGFYLGLVREVVVVPGFACGNGKSPAAAPPSPPRYVLPLGTLHVAQDYTQEPTPTASFVVMDMTTPRKALWLVEYGDDGDEDDKDKEKAQCRMVMLAPDMACWRLANEGGAGPLGTLSSSHSPTPALSDASAAGSGAGGSLNRTRTAERWTSDWGVSMNVGGLLGRSQQQQQQQQQQQVAGPPAGGIIPQRATLDGEYPETEIVTAVSASGAGKILFRRPTRHQALRAIQEGWGVHGASRGRGRQRG